VGEAVVQAVVDKALGWLPHGYPVAEDVWRSRHRSVLVLLWLHVGALSVFGVVRGYPMVHMVADVLPIVGLTMLATRLRDRTWQASAATLGLVGCSGVLVHLSGGSIEAHFHFFVMVGVVTIYQMWVPFVVAVGFVLVHHTTVGIIDPKAVYDHQSAINRPWLWAGIHALFLLASALASLRLWKHVEDERVQAQEAAAAEREQTVRLAEAITINDTIVQDLVAARYAAELGDAQHAQDAIEACLIRAQALVADLMQDKQDLMQPGGLRGLALRSRT
jgi:uncharacterized membrane protein